MGPERLDRARTVESIAAVTASSRPPWAGAVLVRYPPRAAVLAAGAAVGLPGAPAGGHGELLFPTVDAAGRSVGAGRRNRPCVAVLGLRQREGAPLGRVSSAACRARTAYSLSSEAPIPLPGNNPVMVPAAVAAIPCLPLPAVDPCTLPATPPSPRPGHPLHPMTAGHATGPKQGRDYRYRRPDRRRLRIGYSRLPGGAAKAVLSPSSPPPERPWAHSLRGVPGSRGGCAPVV